MGNETLTDAPVIELGKVYRDKITGFEGTAVGECKQVLLSPKVKDTGEYVDGHWFDDARLLDVESEKPVPASGKPGGPSTEVGRRARGDALRGVR